MSLKNNVIKRRDFERYEIIVPFSSLVGRRRKSFLSSELEKRHPCFSDEFTFDSKVKGLSRKGVCSDVLVMNKYKLAEYENKRRIAGTGFWIERIEGCHDGMRRGRRYFAAPKFKLSLATVYVLLLVVVTGFCSGKIARRSWNEALNLSVGVDESNVLAEEAVTEGVRTGLATVAGTGPDRGVAGGAVEFFKTVSEADGRILSFYYEAGLGTQKISATVKGVYPESLEKFCEYDHGESVVYENGIPVMKVAYSWRTAPSVEGGGERGMVANADFNKSLRDAIIQCDSVLKEEKAPPYHIEFSCGLESKLLFNQLSTLISKDKRSVTSVIVTPSGNNELRIGLTIECVSFEGFDLSLLSEYLKLFRVEIVQENQKSQSSLIPFSATKFPDTSDYSSPNKKIGVIRRPDNSYVIFYKTPEGKLKTFIEKQGGSNEAN